MKNWEFSFTRLSGNAVFSKQKTCWMPVRRLTGRTATANTPLDMTTGDVFLPMTWLLAEHGGKRATTKAKKQPEPKEMTREERGARLHKAAEDSCWEMVQYLISLGADLEVTSRRQATPLLRAAEGGHTRCVKLLTEAGADTEAADVNGKLPLHGAVEAKDALSVWLLLKAGADPDGRDNQWISPREQAMESINPRISSMLTGEKPGSDEEFMNRLRNMTFDSEEFEQFVKSHQNKHSSAIAEKAARETMKKINSSDDAQLLKMLGFQKPPRA